MVATDPPSFWVLCVIHMQCSNQLYGVDWSVWGDLSAVGWYFDGFEIKITHGLVPGRKREDCKGFGKFSVVFAEIKEIEDLVEWETGNGEGGKTGFSGFNEGGTGTIDYWVNNWWKVNEHLKSIV